MQFTEKDISFLQDRGIRSLEVERQLDLLYNGSIFPRLKKCARANDGIFILSDAEKNKYFQLFLAENSNYKITRFIPASGVASRMFAHLLDVLIENKNSKLIDEFFERLNDFSFAQLIPDTIRKEKQVLLKYILGDEGLKFNRLPKALIPFHKNENEFFTAFESHLLESCKYLNSNNQIENHFTISENFQLKFEEILKKDNRINSKKILETSVEFSYQEKQTDTVSIHENREIVRDGEGNIAFRKGGHGALLKNLQSINGDIIFIRNIDNVISPANNDEYVYVHQYMGGMLIHFLNILFSIQRKVDDNKIPDEAELKFLQEKFFYKGKLEVNSLHDFVFRPLRICGMVKNEGEPGGGPFWVEDKTGQLSLQIIESSQVNPSDHHQGEIFKSGTHFNPVDICCSIKNCRGEKYDLMRFRNEEFSFLANKNSNGKNITVLEHPGLWNGSMHHWLTIFIEIPISVFNPVKTVNDLLRPAHLK
jgi:hypothetical protein